MENRNHNILNTDRIGPLLLKLTMPAFFGMFVQTLYNVISTIFVGHFVGPEGIGGLSIVFPLQMLAFGFGMMVGIGGASLISRQLGAGDNTNAERTLGNGFSISIILYIMVIIVVLPFMDFWLRLIGASDVVLPYAKDYLVFIIAGSFFSILSMALLSFARAEGNARVGMTAMIIGALLSIGLCALFIIVLDMGVMGAGLATMISQFVSMAYLLAYYLTGSSYLKLSASNFRPDFKILKDILAIGIGAFTQTVASSLSMMILLRLVVSYGGDTALYAFGIVQRLMMFAIMPGMVIGQGAQPILGYNYGAKRHHLLLKTISIAAITSTTLSVLVFLVLYFIPEPLIRIFTSDPEVVSTGGYVAKLVFLSMPLMGSIQLGTQMFQAIGKALQAFITAIVRPVVFLIPLVFIMSKAWQLDGVLLSLPASDFLTFILILFLISPIIRQFRRAVVTEPQDKESPLTTDRLAEPIKVEAND
jgi:putative MATE family efflux protein